MFSCPQLCQTADCIEGPVVAEQVVVTTVTVSNKNNCKNWPVWWVIHAKDVMGSSIKTHSEQQNKVVHGHGAITLCPYHTKAFSKLHSWQLSLTPKQLT